MSILTVTGPVDSSTLSGHYLCSEHLFYDAMAAHPSLSFDGALPGAELMRLKPVSLEIVGHLRFVGSFSDETSQTS